MVEGGFPHSEILGSKLVRSSPRLIAAYHVLHRLSAPRHPPDALKTLDHSHDRCPPPLKGSRTYIDGRKARRLTTIGKTVSGFRQRLFCLPSRPSHNGCGPSLVRRD